MSSTASAKFKLLLGSVLAMLLGLLGTLPALHSAPVPKQGKAGWEQQNAPVCIALSQDETRKAPADHAAGLDCVLAGVAGLVRFSISLGSVQASAEGGRRATPRTECVRGPPAVTR